MKVFVAGSGIMGCGIAVAVAAKHDVLLYDINEDALNRASKIVSKIAAEAEVDTSKIKLTSNFNEVSKADLFIESVPESVAVKVPVLQKAEKLLPENAIICSNTSVISINDLAEHIEAKYRFSGLHWMNPPHVLPLVEIVTSNYTSKDTIAKLRTFLEGLEKKPVVCRDKSLVNRFNAAVLYEAAKMIEEGVTFKEIDDVWRYHLGILYTLFGPLGNIDYIGLDIVLAASRYLYERYEDEKFKPPEWLERCVSSGKLGVKSGSGIYRYSRSFEEEYSERIRRIRDMLKFLDVR